MRILITGATGFIGFNLTKALSQNHTLAILLRPEAKKEKLFEITPAPEELIWNGKMEEMLPLLERFKPDCVMHLASVFVNGHQPKDLDPLLESNIRFPTILLDAMIKVGCTRFINTGSIAQHFENGVYSPLNLYAATKQAFADILTFYIEAGGLRRVITLELSDTYGSEDPRSKLIALLQRTAIKGETLGMSPGYQHVDFVHVDDVVRAYEHSLTVLEKMPDGQQSTFAIRSGRPLTVRDFVFLYNSISPNPVNIEWDKRPYATREFIMPWTQGKILPNWEPKISLKDGLTAVFSTTEK